ncbi:MAG TPA: ABC transporter ATP-binding protein [Chloroflexi bacterium]|nr:ABC transporter ATP-binding protein [Chloroflexota bacterium]
MSEQPSAQAVAPGPQAETQVATQSDKILDVKDLHTYFFTDLGVARALNGVTYSIPREKVLGVVGESGCGKSVTALSIMQLVQPPGRIVRGEIVLHRQTGKGEEDVVITHLDRHSAEMRRIRGAEIAMIFQEPMTSLNPVYTIGAQIMEAVLLHHDVDKAEARARAIRMLDRVGMPSPEIVVDQYPHQISGGMRQRAMIALALSCSPSLLIADEPTTALDVTTEAQILDLMRELQHDIGMSIMFITHDLGVIAQMADEVVIMYLGRIVEQSPVVPLFYDPKHPYTKALLRSIPHISAERNKERLQPIRGVVPNPYSRISGCPFHPRCDSFMPGVCDVKVPGVTRLDDNRTVRCFLYSDRVEENNEQPS